MSINNNEENNKLNENTTVSDQSENKKVRKKTKTVSIKNRINAQESGQVKKSRSIRERKSMALNDETGFLDDGLTMQLPQLDDEVMSSFDTDSVDSSAMKAGSEKARMKKAVEAKAKQTKARKTVKAADGTGTAKKTVKATDGTGTAKKTVKAADGTGTAKKTVKAADGTVKRTVKTADGTVKKTRQTAEDANKSASANKKTATANPVKKGTAKQLAAMKAVNTIDENDFDEADFEEEEYLIKQRENKDGKSSLIKRHLQMQDYKKFLIIAGVALVILGIGYFAGMSYFGKHFAFNTTINGQNCSMKTPEEVEQIFADEVGNYALEIQERDGSTEKIQGSAINLAYHPGDSIDVLLSKQDNAHWLKSLIKKSKLTTALEVTYDEKQLTESINALNCMNKDNQTKAKSAKPEYDGEKFAVTKESQGTVVKKKVMAQTVSDAITSLQASINLADDGCYKAPKYTTKSEEVTEACKTMNKYIKSKIVYQLQDDKTQTVTGEKIAKWLSTDSDMEVEINEESVKEYVSKIADKCDTYGEKVSFKKTGGGTIKVSGYDFGYRVDQDKEYETLVSNIKGGKTVKREPEYSQRGDEGIGDTYAEVDLKNQVMYFYKNGKKKLETDIVSGNPNYDNETPTGLYKLAYKETDKVLRGEQDEDGNYEYESPVSYWMPFNGGIGFHDATWQAAFGGDRYLTNGSHGCINMPLAQAKKLYNLIEAGDPVILYK